MSDEWKQKYLASLDRHERAEEDWQAMETLLRQGLTRVALAAQGLDSRLDGELEQLRKAIRSGADRPRLAAVIETISASVKRLDEQRAGQQTTTPQELLSRWLDSLALPRELRSRARGLRRAIDQAVDVAQMEAPLRELAALLNTTLQSDTGAAGGGLLRRLFGGGAEAGPRDADNTPGDEPPLVSEFCILLLDTLSLPAALAEEVETLKDRLAEGMSEQSVAPALTAIADLISTMRRQMEAENQELQDFLRQLTGRLQELDQNLAGAQTQHRAAIHSGRELDAAVQDHMRHIETSVDQTDDPEQLKAQIQERLEAIRRHLDEHRHSDEVRQLQLETQLAALNDRIHDMEKESESLRARLREKHEQAVHDTLTGLYNRLAYDERMAQEFARWNRYHQPLVLLILDIDRFKRINDNYGHKAGDKALKIIAERIRDSLRESDFLARYGGEEFVVVMPETEWEDALGAAEKLRAAVEQSDFHYQGQRVPITVSIGLATPQEGDSPEALFQRADRALYCAKEEGRNRISGGGA